MLGKMTAYLFEEVGVCDLLGSTAPGHFKSQQVRCKGSRQVEAEAIKKEEEN